MADEAGSHTRPDAAGGEAGHGAAKLDPVIHRYVFYRNEQARRRSTAQTTKILSPLPDWERST